MYNLFRIVGIPVLGERVSDKAAQFVAIYGIKLWHYKKFQQRWYDCLQ